MVTRIMYIVYIYINTFQYIYIYNALQVCSLHVYIRIVSIGIWVSVYEPVVAGF